MKNSILQRLVEHDRSAIEEVYASCYPSIRQFIVKNSGSEVDAQDVFQDALLVLYKNAKGPDFELRVQVCTYLYAVARNIWFKQLRKNKASMVTLDQEVISTEEALDDQELLFLRQRLYRNKFAELGSDCQRVLSMFYDGASMEAIADALGYGSSGYARKKKFSCKQKLLNLIRQDPLFNELSDHE